MISNDKGGTSTLLTLKFKYWSDFIFAFTIRIRDKGSAGVVWRFKDVFNYYML